MSNILSSIILEDENGLRKSLSLGWNPDKIDQKSSGMTDDLIVWIEVLSRDWSEGLEVLDEYFPKITRSENIWQLALRYNGFRCIEFLWKYHADDNTTKQISKQIMMAMESKWVTPDEDENILRMMEFLKNKNFNLHEPVIGDFEYGDLRIQGHNIWTRAMYLRKCNLVDTLWPKNDEWKSWPRCTETILGLVDAIVNDKALKLGVDGKNKHVFEKKILLRWIEEFGIEWIGSKYEDLFPKPNEFYAADENKHEELYFHLAKPTSTKISPWFRLFLHLDESERQILWGVWIDYFKLLDRSEQGNDLLWLKSIAMHPNDKDVIELLDVAKKDNAEAIMDYWFKDGRDGVSPDKIFNVNFLP